MPLDDIRKVVGCRGFDVRTALERHKVELRKRISRLERLIATVDDTILHLKGKKEMSQKQFFEPFSEEKQAEYEKEAMRKYDPATVKAASQKWKNYSAAEKKRIMDEGNT
jgi:hypothetical protein